MFIELLNGQKIERYEKKLIRSWQLNFFPKVEFFSKVIAKWGNYRRNEKTSYILIVCGKKLIWSVSQWVFLNDSQSGARISK